MSSTWEASESWQWLQMLRWGGTPGKRTMSSRPGGGKSTEKIHKPSHVDSKPSHVDRSSAVWVANTLSK